MATASKEENSTRKAQALYVSGTSPSQDCESIRFFWPKKPALRVNQKVKDCIFQWIRSFLTNSLNSWLAKPIVIYIAQH